MTANNTAVKLKDCPFCGGHATIKNGEGFANIWCDNKSCGMYLINKVRSCRDTDMAIKAWNTRTEQGNKEITLSMERLIRTITLRSPTTYGVEKIAHAIISDLKNLIEAVK